MLNNKKNTFEQHDNENGSFYHNSVSFPVLLNNIDDNFEIDVCVIGGGLTGISSALNLASKGYSVMLLEARKIGWGASGRNGGQLGIGMRKNQFFLGGNFSNFLTTKRIKPFVKKLEFLHF